MLNENVHANKVFQHFNSQYLMLMAGPYIIQDLGLYASEIRKMRWNALSLISCQLAKYLKTRCADFFVSVYSGKLVMKEKLILHLCEIRRISTLKRFRFPQNFKHRHMYVCKEENLLN